MTGKKSIEHQLITIAEALRLSEHIKISEQRIALELFEAYTKKTRFNASLFLGVGLCLNFHL